MASFAGTAPPRAAVNEMHFQVGRFTYDVYAAIGGDWLHPHSARSRPVRCHGKQELDIRNDILVTALLIGGIHLHLVKLLDLAICFGESPRLGSSTSYPCDGTLASKLHAILRSNFAVWKAVWVFNKSELYLLPLLAASLAWLLTALASLRNPAVRRFYTTGGRLALLASTRFACKAAAILTLALWPAAPLSSYCKRYMPFEGLALLVQALAVQVPASAQTIISAADAASTFYCCLLLSDRWPYDNLSMGAVLASSVAASYISLMLTSWREARRRVDATAAEVAGDGGQEAVTATPNSSSGSGRRAVRAVESAAAAVKGREGVSPAIVCEVRVRNADDGKEGERSGSSNQAKMPRQLQQLVPRVEPEQGREAAVAAVATTLSSVRPKGRQGDAVTPGGADDEAAVAAAALAAVAAVAAATAPATAPVPAADAPAAPTAAAPTATTAAATEDPTSNVPDAPCECRCADVAAEGDAAAARASDSGNQPVSSGGGDGGGGGRYLPYTSGPAAVKGPSPPPLSLPPPSLPSPSPSNCRSSFSENNSDVSGIGNSSTSTAAAVSLAYPLGRRHARSSVPTFACNCSDCCCLRRPHARSSPRVDGRSSCCCYGAGGGGGDDRHGNRHSGGDLPIGDGCPSSPPLSVRRAFSEGPLPSTCSLGSWSGCYDPATTTLTTSTATVTTTTGASTRTPSLSSASRQLPVGAVTTIRDSVTSHHSRSSIPAAAGPDAGGADPQPSASAATACSAAGSTEAAKQPQPQPPVTSAAAAIRNCPPAGCNCRGGCGGGCGASSGSTAAAGGGRSVRSAPAGVGTAAVVGVDLAALLSIHRALAADDNANTNAVGTTNTTVTNTTALRPAEEPQVPQEQQQEEQDQEQEQLQRLGASATTVSAAAAADANDGASAAAAASTAEAAALPSGMAAAPSAAAAATAAANPPPVGSPPFRPNVTQSPPPALTSSSSSSNSFARARALVAGGGRSATYDSPALLHTSCGFKVPGLTPADVCSARLADRAAALLAEGPWGRGMPPPAAAAAAALAAAAGARFAAADDTSSRATAVGVYVREGCIEL
ncbi:hypothetical protein Agub_g15054, partial [Astrephomene gubernaculifera]